MSISNEGIMTFELDFETDVGNDNDITPTVQKMIDVCLSLPDGKIIDCRKMSTMMGGAFTTVVRQGPCPFLKDYKVYVKRKLGWANAATAKAWRNKYGI